MQTLISATLGVIGAIIALALVIAWQVRHPRSFNALMGVMDRTLGPAVDWWVAKVRK